MESIAYRPLARLALLGLVALLAVIPLSGQRSSRDTGENFDSPTPILLSEDNSTRALTQMPLGKPARTTVSRGHRLGTKIDLFVSDLSLLPGEGANAFRVYATDVRGNVYRFPVLEISQVDKNVWSLTTLLSDEIGYSAPLQPNGDLAIYVAWRGLASNTCRLGLGRTGDGVKDEPFTKPTPLGTTRNGIAAPTALPIARQADRLRFQEQAGFGPTPAFSAQLDRVKLSYWIESQFAAPYPTFPYPAQPLQPVNAIATCDGSGTDDVPATCFRDSYTMYPAQTWNSQEMLYGSNQLRHKMAWALSQIWVTSGVDIQQSRWMVEYHKILSNNAFGNYRTLMRQMTLSPTMGQYLSMNQSTRANPNENYAREIMQLFTIGLFMLNPDGTFQCIENNPCLPGDTKIPTYDQNNVNNLTRVFTGWTNCNVGCTNSASGIPNYIDPMVMTVRTNHDVNAKTLLNYPGVVSQNIAACPVSPAAGACNAAAPAGLANTQAYASATMDQALDNIFYHPNLGPYVSKILIQQLVTSDPTPAYVGRVAAAFNNNGLGVRGDMKAVISAILLDMEARGNAKTDPNYGKLREPVQFATNILRSFNVRNAAGTGQSDGVLTTRGEYLGMGQNPFRSPTVFNYYPPSFVIPGTALLGPEFALMTTGTAVQRTNFVNRIVFSSPAIPVSAGPDVPSGTSLDFSDLLALSTSDTSGNALVDELNRRMLHGTMSASMKSTILTALAPTPATDLARVRQAVYLVATSSQYQVQR